MKCTKETFKTDQKWLTDKKNSTGLCQWNEGYLEALNDYKNLILFGVGCSEPKEYTGYIVLDQKRYIHKAKLQELINNGTYIEVK